MGWDKCIQGKVSDCKQAEGLQNDPCLVVFSTQRDPSGIACIHNWPLQYFSQDYDLTSHITYVACVNF